MNQASIFSKRTDFYLFLVLPMVLIALLFLNLQVSITVALALILIDQLHVYFTYIQSDFWQRITRDPKQLFIAGGICALAMLATYAAFIKYDLIGIFMVVKYLTIFHFCRQQYGWLRIIQTKMQMPKIPAKISEVALQIFCLAPILIGHSEAYYFTWFPGVPNLFSIPDFIAGWILFLYVAACLLYFLFELHGHLKNQIPVNLTRLSILLFTFFSWNFVILGRPELSYSRIFLLAGHHVLSYIFLVYFFNTSNLKQKKGRFLRNSLIVTVLFLVIIALRNSIKGMPDISLKDLSMTFSEESYRIFYFMIPFLWMLTVFHFILDGFIWKKALSQDKR